MTGRQISHYKILEKLGEGGMGVVYKALDIKLDRDVALKFLTHPSTIIVDHHNRFLQEARSIAKINHANICQIYGIEMDGDGNQFIVMEFINGTSLRDYISGLINTDVQMGVEPDSSLRVSDSFKSKYDRVLNYAIQIAKGLEAAHEQGIIHRDIKPENIIITKSDEIKILDFGLAKIAATDQLTKEGSTLGTISYMSPEQIRGEILDSRSDIWSFGIVLYQMVSGRLPFGGDYEHSIMYSIINTDPPPIEIANEDIPPGLEKIINRCISKDPVGRYQSSTELLTDLKDLTGFSNTQLNKSAGKFKSLNSITAKKNKRRLLFSSGIFAGILLIGYLLTFVSQSGQSWFLSYEPEFIHLAVLPFTNIGADPARQVFTDGLFETITSQLSQLEQFQKALWVVPSGEIRKENILSAGQAYQIFGVNYVIAGSLQPISDRLRLTITLIDSENLRQLNSSVIDVDATDVLGLHVKSVENLLAMLNLELNPETIDLIHEEKTSVPAAFELYIEGLGYLQSYEDRVVNINNAINSFKEAVQLDSQFALAFAGLGQAYWRMYEYTKDGSWIELATEQSKTAYELNNNLLQANISLGMIHTGTGRYEEAIMFYNDALSKDPTSAEAYLGLAEAYEYDGKFEDAESTYKRAIQLKSEYWAGYNFLGSFYYRISNYEKAKVQFQRVIDITPDNYRGYMNLGSMYYFTEQLEEARLMYERSLELENTYTASSNLGTLYYIEGRFGDSAQMYEKALEINDGDYQLWGNLAVAYYNIPGKQDQAFPIYERAIMLALDQHAINPNNPDILISLAGYEAKLGNEKQSRSYIRTALVLAPENATIMYLAGAALEFLGDRDEALANIEKAINAGYSLSEIRSQPELQKLIADERFDGILKNLNQ
ncbi:hypothetical protein BH23BAC3_BH23BAC3_30570 [soil metagenome]